MNIPAPRLLTILPDESNLTSGATLEPSQVAAPHLSKTQTLAPSRSMSIPAVEPTFLPSGNLKKLSTVRYGLGWEFGAWARTCAVPPDNANPARTAVRVNLTRPVWNIGTSMEKEARA